MMKLKLLMPMLCSSVVLVNCSKDDSEKKPTGNTENLEQQEGPVDPADPEKKNTPPGTPAGTGEGEGQGQGNGQTTTTPDPKPTQSEVAAFADSLQSDFDSIMSTATTDIQSAANAPTKTFYQARTTRQLMSVLLQIKTYEATGKKLAEYKTINNAVDSELNGVTDFDTLYQANEKGLIKLLAVYSSSVDKDAGIAGVNTGTTAKGNFADIRNKIPTAVLYSAKAIREAIEAEQSLDLSSFYDAKLTDYNNQTLNIHKLHTAFIMRADTALFVLEQVNATKAKSLRDAAASLRLLISSGYQIAELWSQAEMDAVTSTLDYYMDL